MAQRPTGGRSRAAVFLLISAVAASLAVLVIYRLIASYQAELAEATKPPETVPVVVAKATLNQGQTLTEEDLEIRQVQPEFVPETVYRDKADVLGRVPLERIIQGEFVRVERLAEPTAGVGLNALIPQGHRALSINITDGSAVSGFLNPGNYVDVLVTVAADSPDKRASGKKVKQTVTMLQARKVLAVDSRIGGDATAGEGGAAPSVTLALTPEEAEKVTHANTEGKVTLTLRNDVDVTQVETNGARAAKLVGKDVVEFKPPPKKAPPAKKPEEQTIQIIKGTKVQVEKQPGGK
jgi:pilus assembly protein CpaB